MKKLIVVFLLLAGSFVAFAQAPHIYEHDYPVITAENSLIRSLMDSVSLDSINANIEHLSGYHTRRYDSRFIYDVQDWLVSRYKSFGADTVMLHDFEVPYFEQGTADNIIAVKWGTKTPQEYVICGHTTTHGTPMVTTPTPSARLVPTTTPRAWQASSKQPDC